MTHNQMVSVAPSYLSSHNPFQERYLYLLYSFIIPRFTLTLGLHYFMDQGSDLPALVLPSLVFLFPQQPQMRKLAETNSSKHKILCWNTRVKIPNHSNRSVHEPWTVKLTGFEDKLIQSRFLCLQGAVLMKQTTTRASAMLATKDEIVITITMTARHLHA